MVWIFLCDIHVTCVVLMYLCHSQLQEHVNCVNRVSCFIVCHVVRHGRIRELNLSQHTPTSLDGHRLGCKRYLYERLFRKLYCFKGLAALVFMASSYCRLYNSR